MAEKGINEADHALLRTISLSSPNQSWPLHHIQSVALSLIKKGFTIYIDPKVRVGHEKTIVYIDK